MLSFITRKIAERETCLMLEIKNYIKPLKEFKHLKPVEPPLEVTIIHGPTKIELQYLIHLFYVMFIHNCVVEL